ncbi:Interferon-induced very large GTPase 1 [Plecturocebus cupreus]
MTLANFHCSCYRISCGLTATVGDTAISSEEKTQHMLLMRHHMGQSLSKEVAHILNKPGADHDWENLEKDEITY